MNKLLLQFAALVIAFAATGLSGCVHRTDQQPLTPVEDRVTDGAIAADIEYLIQLQDRIAVLNANGVPAESYELCKAQAWLDMAINEYHENDRTGVVEAALEQSLSIVQQLEAGDDNVGLDTPVVATSTRVREDLWGYAENIKTAAAMSSSCASCELARFEVQLVWIGHEQGEMGWRHALPAVQAAERLQRNHRDNFAQCSVAEQIRPLEPTTAQTTGSEPTPLTFPAAPEPEVIAHAVASMPKFVHFAFDSDALSAKSHLVLNRIVDVLAEYPTVQIELEGHADLRGTTAYNLSLSGRRVAGVYSALLDGGIDASRIQTEIAGPFQPRALGGELESYARNRRVEINVLGGDRLELLPEESDLQIEK